MALDLPPDCGRLVAEIPACAAATTKMEAEHAKRGPEPAIWTLIDCGAWMGPQFLPRDATGGHAG
jgi:hypothetical protein